MRPHCGGPLDDALKAIFKFSIVDDVLAEHTLKGQSKVNKESFIAYTTLFKVIFGKEIEEIEGRNKFEF